MFNVSAYYIQNMMLIGREVGDASSFLPVLRIRIRSDICGVGVSSPSHVRTALCRNISSSNKFFGENACTVKFSVAYYNPNINRFEKKVAGN